MTRPAVIRRARWFLLSWLAFTAMILVWSVGTPTLGAADEASHAIKAAAVVRAEWVGTNVGPKLSPATDVSLPGSYATLQNETECFRLKPSVPASCEPTVAHVAGSREVGTSAGRYPPLYYLVTGWPSLLLSPPHALLAMRIVSAVLSGFFLAVAVLVAVLRCRPMLAFATSVATTPAVLFFAGVENPSGLEITVSVLVWVCGILLLVDRPPPRDASWLLALLATALAVLVLIRAISPLWAVLVLALLMIGGAPGQVGRLLRMRRTYLLGAGVVAVTLLAAAWTVGEHALILAPDTQYAHQRLAAAIRGMWSSTPGYIVQLVGVLGALDTSVSYLAVVAWYAVVGMLMLLAFALGSGRLRTALLLTAVAVVALPIAIGAPDVSKVGYAWQGRYTLPLAVGLPLLAAFALDQHRELLRALRLRITVVIAIVLGAAEIFTVWTAVHRWAVGVTGPMDIYGARWQAAHSTTVYLLVALGVVTAFQIWMVRLAALADTGRSFFPARSAKVQSPDMQADQPQ